MRNALFLLALSISSCQRSEHWTPSKAGEIFRYTAVGTAYPLDSIVLGERWKTASKYGADVGDTLTTLPAHTFGGADAIRVRRDGRGLVTAIEFDYDTARDVRAIVEDYQSDLGPAQITTDSVGLEQRRSSTWHDAFTDFRIIEFMPPKSAIAATAVLSVR